MRYVRMAALLGLLACLAFPFPGRPTPAMAAEPPPTEGADVLSIPQRIHAGTKEDPWPVFNSATVAISFKNAYQDAQIVRADAKVLKEDGTEAAEAVLLGEERFPKAAESWKIPIRQQVESLDNGLYCLMVRVWDEHGNVSEWSAPCWGRKLWRQLEPPGGCALLR